MHNGDRSRGAIYAALLIPTVIYLILFWFIPLINIAIMSLTSGDSFILGKPVYVGLQNYVKVLESYSSTVTNTLLYPFAAAVIDLALGYPLAYFLVRGKVKFQNLLRASLIFPYFGDIYVSYGLWNMFLPGGLFDFFYSLFGISYKQILYTPYAVIAGFSIFTLPFMVLYVSSALSEVDPALEEAAYALGATPLKTFLKVVLPLSAPGAIAGFLACFGWNMGGFLIPLLLGGVEASNVITVNIVYLTLQVHNYGVAATLAVILTIITVICTYATFEITKVAG
ncbi:ABC transporter permease subunit [Thermofilum sp.]|uniref:ABC transporter permease n=1 Tax=Thermofilum sp. TaxID=1961369 RepID=UPI003160D66E